MNLRKFVRRVALTAAVPALAAFLACPAYADDVTLTMSPASLTVTEGNSLTITFTGTNVSSDAVQTDFILATTGIFGGPDLNDVPSSFSISPGTCTVGGLILGPGASCTFSFTFGTDNPSGETDTDFGMETASAALGYCVFSVTGACTGINGGVVPFQASSGFFNVTVTDPAPTPEPSSVHLVLAGLTALLGLGWLRSRN
jgi:hypothetical protein